MGSIYLILVCILILSVFWGLLAFSLAIIVLWKEVLTEHIRHHLLILMMGIPCMEKIIIR